MFFPFIFAQSARSWPWRSRPSRPRNKFPIKYVAHGNSDELTELERQPRTCAA
jgi:hypothetical protein